MRKIFLCISIALLMTGYSKADSTTTYQPKLYTPETVPNPKEANSTYISDPDNLLYAETKSKINALFSDLEKKTSDQVALVVLNSIGEEVPKDFAYKLFNLWGVGIKGKDNGLLILMVMDQRRIEFETGYGMEGVLPDALCKRIQMNYMVPRFKEENYDQGLLDGIQATVDILQNPENSTYFNEMEAIEYPVYSEEKHTFLFILAGVWMVLTGIFYAVKVSNKSFTDLYNKAFQDEKAKITLVISKQRWMILYILVPILLLLYLFFILRYREPDLYIPLVVYGYLVFIFFEKRIRSNARYKRISKGKDYYENYKKYTKAHEYWFWTAFLFPVPFLFYVLYYLKEKHQLRNHPRDCEKCAQPFLKLNEKEDDQHLSKAQLLEEQLNSIDYDVWFCGSCASKQVLSFKNVFSRYSECTSCKTRAYYLHSDVTVESATYDSTGRGLKTYKCKYCGDVHTESYTIAKKVRSSDSSSSSSSSYSSGGGSSYGGGSSGGGGSGSSW